MCLFSHVDIVHDITCVFKSTDPNTVPSLFFVNDVDISFLLDLIGIVEYFFRENFDRLASVDGSMSVLDGGDVNRL